MKKGFTFIEIIIGILILGMIALFLANILLRSMDVYSEKQQEQEVFSNVQIILDRLTREIRQGSQVLDISSSTETLGRVSIQLSTGDTREYSYTLYNGKYYFTVDGDIQAGPIKELRFMGLDSTGTYTTLTSSMRTLSITLVMDNNEKYSTVVSLRAETPPQISGVFITEIMYYPAEVDKNGTLKDERDMEFIVIYNGTTYTINLERWQINGTTRISEAVIPLNDFNLPPGRYAVVGGKNSDLPNSYYLPSNYHYYRTQQRGLYQGNSPIPNSSGTITLEDNRVNIIDQVSYSNTWGGYPSGKSYYSLLRKSINLPSQNPSTWTSNPNLNYSVTSGGITYYSYCFIPRLIITEIMYYPSNIDRNRSNRGERNMEFVEIYNPTNQPVNIYNWRINNNPLTTLVVGSWNLAPGSYAIIGGSGSTLNSSYSLPPNYTYIRTQNSGLGGGTNLLPNTSGWVRLQDNAGNIVNQVNYSNTWGGYRIYEPIPPNYYYYHYSLEKKNIMGISQDPNNWGSSVTQNYYVFIRRIWSSYFYYSHCTPGAKNSISP